MSESLSLQGSRCVATQMRLNAESDWQLPAPQLARRLPDFCHEHTTVEDR